MIDIIIKDGKLYVDIDGFVDFIKDDVTKTKNAKAEKYVEALVKRIENNVSKIKS